MSYRGRRTWPPEWTWISGNYNKNPDSEAGVLENLKPSVVNDCCVFLTMSYGGRRYVATVFFDDLQFCLEVSELLLQIRKLANSLHVALFANNPAKKGKPDPPCKKP